MNIFAYNLEKKTCLPPQKHIHWTSNKFLKFYSFQIYLKGLVYTLVYRIFRRNTMSGVEQDFKTLSNAP